MAEAEAVSWRPSIIAGLTRFWVITIVLIVAGGALGFVAASAQTPKATATASLVLATPSANAFSSDTGATYVADQVAIIRLSSTVNAASKLLKQRVPTSDLSGKQLKNELSVTGGTDSQLVTVSVTDVNPQLAQAATAAVVDTYIQTANKNASDQLAAQIANIKANIAAIRLNINVGPVIAAQQTAQIQLLESQLAQITATGVTSIGYTSSPAELPTAKRLVPPSLGLFAGALAGLVAAIAITRLLAQARQRFAGRFEPELIFATPLLADVPSFSAERLPSDLPAVDSASSSVTEAYRFATTALTGREIKIIAVVSAASGEGKSSCAANLAVTAAYQGQRVLVVDADFEGKGVSFLLGQEFDRREGLLDVLDGTVDFEHVITPIAFAPGLSLLTGGTAAGYDWPDVLSTSRWPQLAQRLGAAFDLVVIDLPPFLQIAYAVPIVRATDGVVVVIPHKSPVSRAAELAERLRFVGVESLGYLYVKAPLRRELGLVSRLATDEDRRPSQRVAQPNRQPPRSPRILDLQPGPTRGVSEAAGNADPAAPGSELAKAEPDTEPEADREPVAGITEVADTEVADTEVADTEVADTEVADTEVADTEVADTEVADTEVADTEVADTEVADTEVADTEVADTEVADTEAAVDPAPAVSDFRQISVPAPPTAAIAVRADVLPDAALLADAALLTDAAEHPDSEALGDAGNEEQDGVAGGSLTRDVIRVSLLPEQQAPKNSGSADPAHEPAAEPGGDVTSRRVRRRTGAFVSPGKDTTESHAGR